MSVMVRVPIRVQVVARIMLMVMVMVSVTDDKAHRFEDGEEQNERFCRPQFFLLGLHKLILAVVKQHINHETHHFTT